MNSVINARGEACPMPLIKAKQAFDEGASRVEISVDNQVAVTNLEKLAKSKEANFTVDKKSEEDYLCIIELTEKNCSSTIEKENKKENIVVVISSNTMGVGDDKLGANLLKGFIYSLAQSEILPNTMIFYNSGAFLTSKDSASLEDLKNLEKNGVEIITCGACLNHYNLADKLEVGTVSNMYEIVERQLKATKLLKP